MTRDSIYINYAGTLEKAAKLEELAQMLAAEARKAEEESAACIAGAWEGSAKDTFMRKNSKAAGKMAAHARQLERCAGMLKFAAEEYYRTEMLALEIFGG